MTTVDTETRTCDDCGNRVRYIPVLCDHDPGCVILMADPRTDQEIAQVLALEYESQSDHDPRAAVLARLLRKV